MAEHGTTVSPAPATSATPRPRLLQRKCACGAPSHGNAECSECARKRGLLQRKLGIGASDDPLEREADRVADQVIGMTARSNPGAAPVSVQRATAAGGLASGAVPDSVERALARSGSPLAPTLRQDMEQRFGHDFSQVRVHVDETSAQSAHQIDANAYTVGRDIVFGRGRFAPDTRAGRHLLAHELTHVVQQSGAPGAGTTIRRDDAGGGSTDFEDKLTMSSRPTVGPGMVEGTVTRTETAPANGSRKREVIHTGEMRVRFDPADCSITLPFGYRFDERAQASSAAFCNEPPSSTPVPKLAPDRLAAIKRSVLDSVNRGLNGWFNIRLSGKDCPGGCAGKPLPIRVAATEDDKSPDTTIAIVNRGGRANSGTICARSWDDSTAEHEGGHQVLGVGDEYPEKNESLRATAPQWFRPERVRHDYSKMGPEEHSRFAMFHERHFNAVKVFLEGVFPGCKATLEARSRPVLPDFRFTMGAGYTSINGAGGLFLSTGLGLGIPLDRLRRWELVLGPQVRWQFARGDDGSREAFLLGARIGLEHSTGGGTHGFTTGLFAEGGAGKFSSTDYGVGGGVRSTWAPYGELGVSAGYRSPIDNIFGNSTRLNLRLEGAAGSAFGAPGIVGEPTPGIESDPQRSHWFRLGLSFGVEI
ncbi:MAG: DUF4157 domain-containing protein [Burkholderiaceae bacterium]